MGKAYLLRALRTLTIAASLLLLALLGAFYYFSHSKMVEAQAPGPTDFRLVWYEEQDDLEVTRLTISHEGSYELPFDESVMLFIDSPGNPSVYTGELYVTGSGTERNLVGTIDGLSNDITFTESGTYELDIYDEELILTQSKSSIGNVFKRWLLPTVYAYPEYLFLTTMRFEIQEEGTEEIPLPTCALAANPASVVAGESATLSWDSEYAGLVTIEPDIGTVAKTGSQAVAPTETTIYTLTAVGEGGETDCATTVTVQAGPIELPLRYQAAKNAIKLVDTPDGYTLGAKGWDYDEGGFISAANVLAGYSYYNLALGHATSGKGVDCSGLVMWSYNHANDASTFFTNNFVKYEGADGQFQPKNGQSFAVERNQLEPGDTMYFDNRGDSRIDHTAMYVGDQDGYDVVNASNPVNGIVGEVLNSYTDNSDFRGFRRVVNAKLAMKVEAGSPVDLTVTDPDGNRLSAEMVEITEEEYLREIPGELYYTEGMKGHDDNPVDIVYGPELKEGQYVIEVSPIKEARPTDTYSLTFTGGDNTIVLAEDEPIGNIPPLGFIVEVAENEDIEVVESTVTDLLEALTETATDADISPRFLKLRIKGNIVAAQHFYERDRAVLLNWILKNLKRLISRRDGRGILTEDAQQMTALIDELLVRLQ